MTVESESGVFSQTEVRYPSNAAYQ